MLLCVEFSKLSSSVNELSSLIAYNTGDPILNCPSMRDLIINIICDIYNYTYLFTYLIFFFDIYN